MQARRLAVDGAFEFTAMVFPDDRGAVASHFHEDPFTNATGRPLFPVAQTLHSRSRKDVVRGIHYTAVPPGAAKYVYSSRGRSLDIVVDIRIGSPTYGRWDSVVLDQESFRALYLPFGVGHVFVSLEEDTVMTYLLSTVYLAEQEMALSPLDPALDLPLPRGAAPIMSKRDLEAPTLAEARGRGALPLYSECLGLEGAAVPSTRSGLSRQEGAHLQSPPFSPGTE
ncbi:dTDP-4-dehydrorhamnose 3,5-epimerase family protein [Nocardiopsis quinghaiensis]|uniref:dTDP-4-dehydrorhamnose 3,5-epimerase family protein n=1 Tax=Nocardiopsis quinghaiensis TaxID=464995 RepID=UPI001238ACD8|nr:dTDP-4-dehydrorhamnose 3,5-epimerase family protein [Nocardiopsis quinghaiensis]